MNKKNIIIYLEILVTVALIFLLFYYIVFPNLDIINNNSGVLSVIFSGLVAIATIIYAILTWKLVSINEDLKNPDVIIDFEPSSKWINFVYIIIKNIGKEPAYNIKFNINPDFEYSKGKYLSKLGFMKGIKYLAPNAEKKSFLMSMAEKNDGKMKPFDIKISYKNKKGKELENICNFDFSEWSDMSEIGKDPMEVISKSIESISKTLNDVTNVHLNNKVQVETFNQDDIKKIKEKKEKYFEEKRRESEKENKLNKKK